MNEPHADLGAAGERWTPAGSSPPTGAAIDATRARIHRLLDAATFVEHAPVEGHESRDGARGHLYGTGTLDGRPVVVSADVVRPRTSAPAAARPARAPAPELRAEADGNRSRASAEQLAVTLRVPLVRLLAEDTDTAADVHVDPWGPTIGTRDHVPVVSLCPGVPRGGNALRMSCSHLGIRVAGEAAAELDAHAGVAVHDARAAGTASPLLVPDEARGFAALRQFLSCVPAHRGAALPRGPRHLPPLAGLRDPGVPAPADRRQPLQLQALLDALFDPRSFLPLHGAHPGGTVGTEDQVHAGQLVAGVARIDGVPLLVLAGDDTEHTPLWHAHSVARALHAVALARRFGWPIVQLVDGPGIAATAMLGDEGGSDGITRLHAMLADAVLPRCVVATRTIHRDAPGAHLPRGPLQLRAAWPMALLSEHEDGAHAAAREILVATALDPERLGRDLDALRAPARAAPQALAARWIDELVAPAATRAYLRHFVELTQPR